MLTHRNMLANLERVNATYGPLLRAGAGDHRASAVSHFALTMNCLLFIELGGQNVLITNPRDIPGLVKELAKYPFTAMTGVNTLFNALLNNKEFQQLDFSTLHLSAGGGMPVQQAVAERWVKLTGRYLLEGYGLTECARWSALTRMTSTTTAAVSVCRSRRRKQNWWMMKITKVPHGEPGAMRQRAAGDAGLLATSDATDGIIKDGWLHGRHRGGMTKASCASSIARRHDRCQGLTSIRTKSKTW